MVQIEAIATRSAGRTADFMIVSPEWVGLSAEIRYSARGACEPGGLPIFSCMPPPDHGNSVPALASRAPGPLVRARATAASAGAGPRAPAYRAAACRPGRLTPAQCPYAVHPHLIDTRCELMRALVGGVILNGRGIEHHDIGEVATLQLSAVGERQGGGGERRQLVDRLRQAQRFVLADVPGEHAREVAVGAWMRVGLEEHALGRRSLLVGIEAHPGERYLAPDVVLRHEEVGDADPRAVLDHQIDRGVLR